MAGQASSCWACSRRLLVLLATGVRVNLRPGVGAVFVPVFVLVGLAAHHLEHRVPPERTNRTSNAAASSKKMMFKTVV